MADLLSFPLKKATDVDIVKPLRNLLTATYSGEAGLDVDEALSELARLRSDAVWKVFDKGSLDVLYSYYDQLTVLESKVPPQEVQVPFKWKDAFDKGSLFGGRMSLTVPSLSFERVCVLWNIGAASATTAAGEPLDTEESLRSAARLLQQAAGVFAHLKGSALAAVHQEPTPDLAPDATHALSLLALAQAQEVIAYKCIRDGMKDGMVARVCAACEEMYAEAGRALSRESVRALWDREWASHVSGRQAAFRGLSQLYQAAVCEAEGAAGERVARLTLAADLLRGARPAALADAAQRAARALAAARRDNDFIYHERVPEAAQLSPVQRAPVAKPLPVPERFGTATRDLFGSLVPASVQGALRTAAARRSELVSAEVGRLRDATQLLNSILASLSLPACVEQDRGAALPASLRERAAAVRAAGGPEHLRRLMQELPELLQRNKDVLDEAERMLREEAEADAALRAQFGARWTRTESEKLTEAFRANAAKYAQIIDNAVRADDIVRAKLAQHERAMEALAGAESALAATLPAGEGGAGEPAAERLRALMREVEELKAERDAIETELQAAPLELRAEFTRAQAAGTLDEPALSAAALGTALGPLQQRAQETLARQERLVARVQEAHAALQEERGGASGRDRALADLAAAADAFQELGNNLQEGVKFYNDLTQLLVTFQNKVSDYCFARKTEKDELLKDLTQAAARVPPPRPAPPAPAHHDPAPAQSAAQPLPYPTQTQGMPLPYAAPGAAPYGYYAPPPMPAMYNPYATLPYPHHARLPSAAPYMPYQHPPHAPGAPGAAPPGYNPYPQ